MAETPSGMLNAVGLQNKGVDFILENTYPRIKKYDTNIFINVSGSKVEDYVIVTEKINEIKSVITSYSIHYTKLYDLGTLPAIRHLAANQR